MSPENQQSFLERGTMLAYSGSRRACRIHCFVDEQDVEQVRAGNSVEVLVSDGSSILLQAKLADVARIDSDRVPDIVTAHGFNSWINDSRADSLLRATAVVELPDSTMRPRYYATGLAKIHGLRTSPWKEIRRFFRNEFPALFGA